MRSRKQKNNAGLKTVLPALAMTALLAAPCFAAGSEAGLDLTDQTANIENETVSVELTLDGSVQADSLEFTVSCDETKLLLDHIEPPDGQMSAVYVASKDRWLMFSSADTDVPITSLGTAVFTIRQKGEAHVSVGMGDVSSFVNAMADAAPVRVVGSEADITVTCKFPGDIDGSGDADLLDLVRLMKWFADSETEVYGPALDVNGDGVTNTFDLIRLLQYLSDPENVDIF